MSKINELIVGIVFFASMSVLGYFTVVKGDLFDDREFYLAKIVFENVEGLKEGDKILVNGVDSGVISKIELREDNNVLVYAKFFRRFKLYENYKILLKNRSALGGRIVVLFPGKPRLKEKSFELVENYENLRGSTIGDPFSIVAELIQDNRDNISMTIDNIRAITGKINSGRGTLGKLINDDKMHRETGKVLEEIQDTIEDVREQAPITSFIRAALTAF